MLWLLLNPLARGAYFNEVYEVALAELKAQLPEVHAELLERGGVSFITAEVPLEDRPQLQRLSWLQAIFEPQADGALKLLELTPEFALPAELVWGNKYRGKTNELITQLALNLALLYGEAQGKPNAPAALLDPMAGRGTTLLWAARYGLDGYGLEREREALEHFQRDVKRQTKLHKIKHKEQAGVIGSKKSPLGKFFELSWAEAGCKSKLIIGESQRAEQLTMNKRFNYIVSDLPYGVQFTGRGSRSPLKELAECAPVWADRLLPGGAMVLVFNALQPKREELIALFEAEGLTALPFTAPHRMSESILRDVVVFLKNTQ